MTRVRSRGQQIRFFILEHIGKHAEDISSFTAGHFHITRQAVNKHLQRLISEGALIPKGNTSDRSYKLASLLEWQHAYDMNEPLEEHIIWSRDVVPVIGALPDNVMDIWHYCFTEMFNNAVDHSGGSQITIYISKTAVDTQIYLRDNGVGIFRKIQTALGLADERHAILELSKGKLTTDPERHTGQGIFFTSRLVDSFDVFSGGVYLSHVFGDSEDWIMEPTGDWSGTTILLKLSNHTARTIKNIFDQYQSEDDFGFIKTVVPVKLAQYGNDKLISRSQAKRVLSRVELFKKVLFDFEGVPTIGQAFADEIFRVFAKTHPDIALIYIRANSDVKRMIESAKAAPLQPDFFLAETT